MTSLAGPAFTLTAIVVLGVGLYRALLSETTPRSALATAIPLTALALAALVAICVASWAAWSLLLWLSANPAWLLPVAAGAVVVGMARRVGAR